MHHRQITRKGKETPSGAEEGQGARGRGNLRNGGERTAWMIWRTRECRAGRQSSIGGWAKMFVSSCQKGDAGMHERSGLLKHRLGCAAQIKLKKKTQDKVK